MYNFYKKHEYLLAIIFVLISQAAVIPFLIYRYPDTDNYTHALRILDLIQSRNWAEVPYMHSNYPFGEILHFTRITDVLWLICAAPLMIILPIKESVFWGGFIFQLLCLMGLAVGVIWSLRPAIPAFFRLIALVVFFLQPAATETYILTKPDHHALTAFFAVLTTGSLIHCLINRSNKSVVWGGVWAGLGLWTSLEGFAVGYLVMIAPVLLWVFKQESLKPVRNYTLSFAITSAVCLAINPPYEGFFSPDNGRLSFLLVSVIGVSALAFYVCDKVKSTDWKIRFLSLSASTLIAVLIILIAFPPDTIFAPWFPPFIEQIWAVDIIELQPSTKSITLFLLCTMPAIVALIIGGIAFYFADENRRTVLALTFFPTLAFGALTLISLRYARLSSIFIPYIIAVSGAVWLSNSGKYLLMKKALWTWLLYILCAGYLSYNYVAVYKIFRISMIASPEIFKASVSHKKGSILTDTSSGPNTIWDLDRPVIGTPYHRNIEGISDNFYMLYDRNIENILFLLKKHEVSTIAIYLAKSQLPDVLDLDWRYREYFQLNSDSKDVFIFRLVRGTDLPCGITQANPVPLPWLVYHVDFSDCASSD